MPPGVPRVYYHPFPFEILKEQKGWAMLFEYDHTDDAAFVRVFERRGDLRCDLPGLVERQWPREKPGRRWWALRAKQS
jgi:hypothetical protein